MTGVLSVEARWERACGTRVRLTVGQFSARWLASLNTGTLIIQPNGNARRAWHPPKFAERFAGERAPLSLAVAMEGHLEVQPPYDLHFGQDMFTEDGRKELDRLVNDVDLYCEHWAPECKLFSKARGKPIRLADGRTIQGPQPVRDKKHLMGFPWLSSEAKARVRRSNNIVLRALRRGKQARPTQRPSYWTLEQPYGSWIWEFTLVKELEAVVGFSHSIGTSCCFGGRREKWYSFFGDLPSLRQYLNRDCPGHDDLEGYTVTQGQDGLKRQSIHGGSAGPMHGP